MKPITKEQAAYIRDYVKKRRKQYPDDPFDIPISTTCRDKSKGKRKRRYLTVNALSLRLLDEYVRKYAKILYDSRFPERYK